jgi:hypothetical protein
MELRRVCNGSSTAVDTRKLPEPVRVTLDSAAGHMAGPARLVTCMEGEVSTHALVCSGGAGPGSSNVTVEARCNGTRAEVPLSCPPLRSCVFFNRTTRAWSSEGCVVVGGWRADRPGPLVCECDHLTDFVGE